MNRNQTLAITLCSLACLGYSTRSANAGWFGPSNYDECVLEKMKGQKWFMAPLDTLKLSRQLRERAHTTGADRDFSAEGDLSLNA